jgi:hypothetical protein
MHGVNESRLRTWVGDAPKVCSFAKDLREGDCDKTEFVDLAFYSGGKFAGSHHHYGNCSDGSFPYDYKLYVTGNYRENAAEKHLTMEALWSNDDGWHGPWKEAGVMSHLWSGPGVESKAVVPCSETTRTPLPDSDTVKPISSTAHGGTSRLAFKVRCE